MELCPICNEYMWLSGIHKCNTRWVALIVGSDDKPDRPFVWSDYSAYTELFSDDAKDAAEDAAAQFSSDISEYESEQLVGIMTYDDYCEWHDSDDTKEDLIDPDKLSWFDVHCEMMPTYNARQRGRARAKED